MCDITLCVTAPLELKLQRIMSRDGITCEKASARISSQLTDSELRERCDYEIDNSAIANVEAQISDLVARLDLKNN